MPVNMTLYVVTAIENVAEGTKRGAYCVGAYTSLEHAQIAAEAENIVTKQEYVSVINSVEVNRLDARKYEAFVEKHGNPLDSPN